MLKTVMQDYVGWPYSLMCCGKEQNSILSSNLRNLAKSKRHAELFMNSMHLCIVIMFEVLDKEQLHRDFGNCHFLVTTYMIIYEQ